MSEPVGDMITKLTLGGLGLIIIITVAAPMLGFFGVVDGTGMDPIGFILFFGVFPIAAVFILFYAIMNIFTRKDKYAR